MTLNSDLPAVDRVRMIYSREIPPMTKSDWSSLEIEMFKVSIDQAKRAEDV